MYTVSVVIANSGTNHRPVSFSFTSTKPTMGEIIAGAAEKQVRIHEIFYEANFAHVDGTLRNRPKWETHVTHECGKTTTMTVELSWTADGDKAKPGATTIATVCPWSSDSGGIGAFRPFDWNMP